jgi:cytochrome oxidase Cu insertion factor (SCO1/SenC/PrrC family)
MMAMAASSARARATVSCRASAARGARGVASTSSAFAGMTPRARRALAATAFAGATLASATTTTTRAFFGGGGGKVSGSAHDFTVKTIDGVDVSMASFKGKACLVVNVASA